MANERWSYQVVEVKPKFLGTHAAAIQERLNQLGMQGWELVAAVQPHRFMPVHLYMKRSTS